MTGLWHLDVTSAWSYAIAVLLPAFDALIPVLPAETALIVLGVATAGSTDPRIALLVALAAAGAFLGDNSAYLLGRRFGPAITRRAFAGPGGARRHAWARRALDRYGARIIIGCRFIPGGRTAVTVTCGLTGYNQRRFTAATAAAGAIWASYAFLIGRLGGKAFESAPWAGLLLGLGIALVISAAAEAARRARPWRILARARARRPSAQASEPHRESAHADHHRPGTGTNEGQIRAVAADQVRRLPRVRTTGRSRPTLAAGRPVTASPRRNRRRPAERK